MTHTHEKDAKEIARRWLPILRAEADALTAGLGTTLTCGALNARASGPR